MPLPALPAELWIRILSYVDDCNTLWPTCRQVSRGFRDWVENQFAGKWIYKTHIDFLEDGLTIMDWAEMFYIPTRFSNERTLGNFALNADECDADDLDDEVFLW